MSSRRDGARRAATVPIAAAREEIPSAVRWNGTPIETAVLTAPPGAQGASLLLDRGLHYGDGLFETIACRAGRPSFLDRHLERLALGCRRLGIGFSDFEALHAEIQALVEGTERAIVKVLVTRGPATSRGYAPARSELVSRIVLRYGWPKEDPSRARDGVAACLSDFTLGENPRLAGLKHLNRLEVVLARADLDVSLFDEALLTSSSGRLVGGTFSNVFVGSASHLKTPRIDRCGVAGVMRAVVMQLANENGIGVEEASLARADLEGAREIFLTNARIGIWPVRWLGNRELGVGPLTRQLQERLARALQEHSE